MVRSSRGLRRVLSGHTCQERLRYSREEDPLIFYSSPDVSGVLWKTCFLWIHHPPVLPGPQDSPNTSKAVARGGWGNITSTLRALSRFPSVPLPPWCQKMLQHPAELHWKATWGGQRSEYTKCQYWGSHMHTKTQKQTCGELNGLCLKCFVTATVQRAWFAPPCSPCAHQASSCTSPAAHAERGFTTELCASLHILPPVWQIAVQQSMVRIHCFLCLPQIKRDKKIEQQNKRWTEWIRAQGGEATMTSSELGSDWSSSQEHRGPV